MIKKLFPFENLISLQGNKSLFVDTVEKVVNSDLQDVDTFGCKIENCHTHVGSKKHLECFFEAELLFHNSYYNKGFAIETYSLINSLDNIEELESILFVGYETFGEMYLNELIDLFSNKNGNSSIKYNYCVAETSASGFKIRKQIENTNIQDYKLVVFVVPISTTLTTHDKLMSIFNEEFKLESGTYKFINLALILIGPIENNNEYWSISNDTSSLNRRVVLKEEMQQKLVELSNHDVYFFAFINAKWNDLTGCSACGNKKNRFSRVGLHEEAIFEVNRASVVPMLQLNVNNIPVPLRQEDKVKAENNLEKVVELINCLIYSHVERNGNHYQYYFNTQKYFENNKIKIVEWLKVIKTEIIKKNELQEKHILNFIVSPRHNTNAGFIQQVNKHVFDGSARIILFDVAREFRGNIKSKYSDLTRLTQNLCKSNINFEMRFHYVDDTIQSGNSYYRIKNLLNTIIPDISNDKKFSRVIFDSIIILLGRNSEDSKKLYIEKNKFYEYVHLSISPMRSHEDACTLCNLNLNFNKLEDSTATHYLSDLFIESIINHKCESIEKFFNDNHLIDSDEEKKLITLINHILQERLNNKLFKDDESIPIDRNNSSDIVNLVNELFRSNSLKDYEFNNDQIYQIAIIKAITRPFFTYHIRQKQAAMTFCIFKLNELLKEKNHNYDLIDTLVKGLADLNALFIIRNDIIEKIIRIYLRKDKDLNSSKYISNYIKSIKRTISNISDDYRSIELEKIILNLISSKKVRSTIYKDVYRIIYFENNIVLYNGFKNFGFEKDLEYKLKERERKQILELTTQQESCNTEFSTNQINKIKGKYFMNSFKDLFDVNIGMSISNSESSYVLSSKFNYVNLITMVHKIYQKLGSDVDIFNHALSLTEIFTKYIDIKNKGKDKEVSSSVFIVSDKFDEKLKDDEIFYVKKGVNGNMDKEYCEFYKKDNLIEIKEMLSTLTYDTFNCDYDEKSERFTLLIKIYGDESSRKNGLMFLFKTNLNEDNISYILFVSKLLMLFRSLLIKVYGNDSLSKEIVKLKEMRIKNALAIAKALQHDTLNNLEGKTCLKSSGCYKENYKKLKSIYIQSLSNNYISSLYRKVIRDELKARGSIYKSSVLYQDDLNDCGFCIGDQRKYYYEFVATLPSYKSLNVKINLDTNNFEKYDNIIAICGVDLFPEYIRLIFLFTINACEHSNITNDIECFEIFSEIEVEEKSEKGYLVVKNKHFLGSNYEKLAENAKNKMEVPPFYFNKDECSITLWTIKTWLESLGIEDGVMISSDKDYFTIKIACFIKKRKGE